MADTAPSKPSRAASAVTQLLAIVALGLIGLPTALSPAIDPAATASGQVPIAAAAWLVLGLALAIWLLIIAPTLARAIGDGLVRVPVHEPTDATSDEGRGAEPSFIGALIVAGGYVILFEAVLRRPLVTVFGALTSPASVDAIVASSALLLLLAVLARLYQTAHPFVAGATRYALDALVPTVDSTAAARFATVDDEVTLSQPAETVTATRLGSAAAPTVWAGAGAATTASEAATVPEYHPVLTPDETLPDQPDRSASR